MLTKLRVNLVPQTKIVGLLALLCCGLSGCVDVPVEQSGPSQAPTVHGPKMIIAGGDAMMQQWTQEAVTAYCVKKYWPSSVKKINHLPAANHPLFNQPRKTKVLVSKDNALHIHFKLGGVLMDNYSHELIVYPPHVAACKSAPMHYELTMQPDGNAVVYVSKPQNISVTPKNASTQS